MSKQMGLSSGRFDLRRPARKALLSALLPSLAAALLLGCGGSNNDLVAPTVSTFSPSTGTCLPAGSATYVTVYGSGFNSGTGISTISIGAGSVPGVAIVYNDAQASFTLPSTATTGPITVNTQGGQAASANAFVVTPQIATIVPAHAQPGATVTITGAGFGTISQIMFGTTPQYSYNAGTATPNQITTTVPSAALPGAANVVLTSDGATSVPVAAGDNAFVVD